MTDWRATMSNTDGRGGTRLNGSVMLAAMMHGVVAELDVTRHRQDEIQVTFHVSREQMTHVLAVGAHHGERFPQVPSGSYCESYADAC
jgi:hypothetical protein